MQLFHTPRTGKILKKENIVLGLYAPTPHCALLGYLFLSSAAICVRVGSYTPAAVCFCVCVLRAHTGSPVTVCRLALSVRSMNGKHSQLCESPISNWIGLPGWSAVLPHIPVLIAPSFPHLSLPQGARQYLAPFFFRPLESIKIGSIVLFELWKQDFDAWIFQHALWMRLKMRFACAAGLYFSPIDLFLSPVSSHHPEISHCGLRLPMATRQGRID